MDKRSSSIISILAGLFLATLITVLFNSHLGTMIKHFLFRQIKNILKKITALFLAVSLLRFIKKILGNDRAQIATSEFIRLCENVLQI
jgi:hypothetical protein